MPSRQRAGHPLPRGRHKTRKALSGASHRHRPAEQRKENRRSDADRRTHYGFSMTRQGVAAGTQVVILEEGETYNWNMGRVERRP